MQPKKQTSLIWKTLNVIILLGVFLSAFGGGSLPAVRAQEIAVPNEATLLQAVLQVLSVRDPNIQFNPRLVSVNGEWGVVEGMPTDKSGRPLAFEDIFILGKWAINKWEISFSDSEQFFSWVIAIPNQLLDQNTKEYLNLQRPTRIQVPTSPSSAASETYKLPYPGGTTYYTTQGNSTQFTHNGTGQYAFDFRLNSTSEPVVAARSGRVYDMRMSEGTGCQKFDCWKKANYIVIIHEPDDMTAELYQHLEQNTALVGIGDWVEQGQPLAWAGASGYTCGTDPCKDGFPGPHLHFQHEVIPARRSTSVDDAPWFTQSIGISFLDESLSAVGGVPQGGQKYQSSGITLYEHFFDNNNGSLAFGGRRQTFIGYVSNLSQTYLGNDVASSAKVAKNWDLMLWKNINKGLPFKDFMGNSVSGATIRYFTDEYWSDGSGLDNSVRSLQAGWGVCISPGSVQTLPGSGNIVSTCTPPPSCYTLSTNVNQAGAGNVSINPAPNCNGGTQYTPGTNVTLIANSSAGYSFSNWDGSVYSSSNPVSIAMNSDQTITANFQAISNPTCFSLSTNANPSGAGSVNLTPQPNCGGGYTLGTVVQLTANANSNYRFRDWSGSQATTNNPTSVTMNSNKWMTANFDYIGGGNDTTPPTTGWNSPANGSTIGSRSVVLSAWAQDNAGGSSINRVSFSAKYNGQWVGLATIYSSPYTFNWDFCQTGVPDNVGDIELGLEAVDNAGNKYVYSEHFTNSHINKSYGCGISSPQWSVDYWMNKYLAGYVNWHNNEDGTYIFRDWGDNGPGGGIPVNEWSARYVKTVSFPGGDYRFHCQHDDGCKIFIDGQERVNGWWDSSFDGHDWGGYISPGTHEVKVEYYDNQGGGRLEAWWQGPGFLPRDENCDSNPTQWCGEYWGNLGWSGTPAIRRVEGEILNHDWGNDSPAATFLSDNFSARWTRHQYFAAGQYRFHLTHDDAGKLFIDGQQVIGNDNCCNEDIKDVYLTEGDHILKVEMNERGGGANVHLWWDTLASCYALNTSVNPVSSGSINSSPAPNCGPSMYTNGTTVSLAASPGSGYSFGYWSSDVGGTSNPTNIVMNSNKTVAANFNVQTPTLTVSKTGTGSGTVTSNPAGVNCGSICSSAFVYNTVVALAATPTAGQTFVGWSGACTGTGACTVTMSSAQAVTANFRATPGDFYKSSPANGATNQPLNLTLSWGSSIGATSYEYCYDTTNDYACTSWVNNGTSTSKALSGLSETTTYYWHVRAVNSFGTTYSNRASTAFQVFTTQGAPKVFYKSAPTNGATNQLLNLTLSWGSSMGATSYEYCYDTTNDYACASWVNNGTSTNKALSGLRPNTTYYWHVRAVNYFGTTYSNVASTAFQAFTTGGDFYKSAPAKDATSQPLNLTLSWGSSMGATSYEYCYDTTNDYACTNWINNGTSTSKALSGLRPNTTYYWHVRAVNNFGIIYSNRASTAFQAFTTGGDFYKTAPTNGATNQLLNLTLSWGSSMGATSYEYCYDTTNDYACTNWVNNGTSTSKALSGLSTSTTYYWHVRAVNNFGIIYSNRASTAFQAFTTGGDFYKSTPAKDATSQPLNLTMSWGSSIGATSYEYCYDTTNDYACTNWINNGASTSKALNGLSAGTTYYWHVRAINSGMTIYSNRASTAFQAFTTVGIPKDFYKNSPAKDATSQPLNLTLSWGSSTDAVSYEYCYDTTNDYACTNWINNGASTSKALSGLSAGTKYYWHVRAVNNFGTTYSNRASTAFQAFTTGQSGGRDIIGIFRPSNGLLILKDANATGFTDVAIGDYPVAGDWDGNGTDTVGIYRNGSFYLRNSNTLGSYNLVFAFGQPGDQPVAGDWDGDGIDTIGVYRNGLFLLRNSNSAGAVDITFALGNPGDVGIAGDWNGDGMDTTGVFRPSNGVIFLKNLNTSGFADIALNYGLAGDQPVIGDWNGDGTDTIGVYRNAQFLLRNSNTIGFADLVFDLGNPGDMPIAGNWDALP